MIICCFILTFDRCANIQKQLFLKLKLNTIENIKNHCTSKTRPYQKFLCWFLNSVGGNLWDSPIFCRKHLGSWTVKFTADKGQCVTSWIISYMQHFLDGARAMKCYIKGLSKINWIFMSFNDSWKLNVQSTNWIVFLYFEQWTF